ncbi:MAG: hypothetical protein HN646_09330 [Nitrospina sp.]|nr:hypothetical protein [Nitrospina sp.]
MASSRTDGLSGAGDVFRPGIVVGFHFSLSGLIPRSFCGEALFPGSSSCIPVT